MMWVITITPASLNHMGDRTTPPPPRTCTPRTLTPGHIPPWTLTPWTLTPWTFTPWTEIPPRTHTPRTHTPRTYTPHNLKCLICVDYLLHFKKVYFARIAFMCNVDAVKLSHICCEEGFSHHNCSGSKWAFGGGWVGGTCAHFRCQF